MQTFAASLWQDLRYGVRVMWKSPGVTLVAMLSLALGIGATTAMFSVVYGVLISPYPYARPSEIWAPGIQNARNPDRERSVHHAAEYLQVQKLPAFASVMATSPGNQLLTGGRTPENFTAIQVTTNAFDFLGVKPVLGRTILPSDTTADGQTEPVIVLSYRAWQRLFDASPDALGKTLVLNDKSYSVIGVMPPRFGWWTNDGGWLPLPVDPRQNIGMFAIMRLRPGVSQSSAEQQLHALHTQLAAEHPADFPKEGFRTVLHNYMDITVASGEMHNSLQLLFGAVGFLLLIACANVANLQMARGTARAREIALRMSIGAARGRVLRQLLTESVLLSFAGGALGILLAKGMTLATVALMPEFYVPNEARITVNSLVLLFSVGISVVTGILFGLLPALQCSRPDLVETLKDAAKGSGARSAGGRTRSALVVAEMALSVILLVGASLTIRGFVKLQHTDVGFQPDRVLMVGLQLPPKRYTTYSQRVAFTQNVLERVSQLPGAQSAAIGNGGLPFGGPDSTYSIDGQPQTDPKPMMVSLISADYGRTLGIPLRAGRGLTEGEVARAEPVALINEAAAKLWPAGQSAIGGRMRLDALANPRGPLLPPGGGSPSVTVVGILANTRNTGLKSPTAPSVFVPYTLIAPTLTNARGAHRREPHAVAERGAAAGTRDRQRPTAAAAHHARRDIGHGECSAALQHGAAQFLRGHGTCAGRGGHLQRAFVQRGAANPRNRHPHGAGSGAPRRAGIGRRVGRPTGPDGTSRWSGRQLPAGKTVAKRSVRRAGHRSHRDPGRCGTVVRDCVLGMPAARQPCR